jgi:hypothetical protein
MYLVVQHAISEPAAFWNAADPTRISPEAKLHHTFPTPDGTHAVCIWEAASVDALRSILEPLIGRFSRNEYFAVENREGLARPSQVAQAAEAAATPGR